MGSQIDKLLDKYWEGKTSLQEEEEIKAYYKDNPSLTPAGLYFRTLKKSSELVPSKSFAHPRKSHLMRWSVAATVLIAITVGAVAWQDTRKQNDFVIDDPEEAYEIARLALMKMSSSLNEGNVYSGELKKINKAEEILNKDSESENESKNTTMS